MKTPYRVRKVVPKVVTELPIKEKQVRLGKKAKRTDKRTFQFHDFVPPPKSTLPQPPPVVSFCTKIPSWPMLLNDQLGCCVISAMGHMVQQWTYFASNGTSMQVMTDAEALSAYEAIGGYVPGDPSTDNGCDMLTALNYWRNNGIVVNGQVHKIAGFVALNAINLQQVEQAIYIFGNAFTGVQLPTSAQGESAWTVTDGGIYAPAGQPGGWGGHCVPEMADSPITLTCVTWGELLKMSHNFRKDYTDEAYGVLSQDWINTQGISPSLFNLAALEAAQRAL